MYRLDDSLAGAIAGAATIIAPSRQRAAALRMAHAWSQRSAGIAVWRTPDILTWDAWLSRELGRLRSGRKDGPALLNPSQAEAQWREVLGALGDAADLPPDLAAHAGAIGSAAATLREWLPSMRAAGPTDETRLLQQALADFDALSATRGVLQSSLATLPQLAPLARSAPRLLVVGADRLSTRQQYLAELIVAAGGSMGVAPLPAPVAGCTTGVAVSADAAAEQWSAGRWCHDWLVRDAHARLLVVCGDSHADPVRVRDAMLAAMQGEWGVHVAAEGGDTLVQQPLVAVAMAWLSLGIGDVELASLSEVLLSPRQQLGTDALCARLDAWLRETAPRRCGANALATHLATAPGALNGVAARLCTAFGALRANLAPGHEGPLEWTRRFVAALQALGYPGTRAADSTEQQARVRWDAALEEYASLQDFITAESAHAALDRLRALLTRSRHQPATGDAPVTITGWPDDPVVGYDAVRVLGLSEAQWPRPPRPDPFLPLDSQRRAGLPESSTSLRLQTARRQLAQWQARAATELVLSHAEVDADVVLVPSPLLAGVVGARVLERPVPRIAVGAAQRVAIERSLPPLVASGQKLPGGVRTATLQRECAFRAQAELRLRAQELPQPRTGIDPSLRGTLVHAALDRLWAVIGDSTTLQSMPVDAWQPAIDAAVEHAFAAAFAPPQPGRARLPPTAAERDRERARCRDLLRAAIGFERQRLQPYAVQARERSAEWRVAGVKFQVTIDRVDQLADGGIAIIDYKTGQLPALDLLGEAPQPVQLLVYLDVMQAVDVAAVALMSLDPAGVKFRSLGDGRVTFPGRKGRKPSVIPDWATQRERWRDDVRSLVQEHLDGFADVAPLDLACEFCPLPALCRIDAARLNATLDAETVDGDADDDE